MFLRWHHALPGHRAFSVHAKSDPRIDMIRLKRALGNKMPEGPEAENHVWYRLFKHVESAPEVAHVHREFLLTRDYAGLAALCICVLGPSAFFLFPSWRVAAAYLVALIAQFAVVRHVAANFGERFVCTVLAVRSAMNAAQT